MTVGIEDFTFSYIGGLMVLGVAGLVMAKNGFGGKGIMQLPYQH